MSAKQGKIIAGMDKYAAIEMEDTSVRVPLAIKYLV